jgi:hypothetical protein
MGRLIDATEVLERLESPRLQVGDTLMFRATGGRVDGGDVLELVGPLQDAALTVDGRVLSPAGPPNVLMFRALRAGSATIEVVTGDPWGESKRTSLEVVVVG